LNLFFLRHERILLRTGERREKNQSAGSK
jgi:hypothetical protein